MLQISLATPNHCHELVFLIFDIMSFCHDDDNNRAFRPDYVFVRQHLKNLSDDFRPFILGLQFGGIPGVNSMTSLYNFTDRPWVVSLFSQQSFF